MTQDSTVFDAAAEYWRDAAQRGVLFMETLNERETPTSRSRPKWRRMF